MARRGDGIDLQGGPWRLDFSHKGKRHMTDRHVPEADRGLVDWVFGQEPCPDPLDRW